MSASNFLENQLITAVLDGGTYTGPTTLYLSLYSTAPTESSAGTELSGSGYARQTVTFSVDVTTILDQTQATNTANVTFGPATADWSTATGWAVTDQSTAGNVLFYNTFNTGQTVRNTKSLTIVAGNLTIVFD